jgi:amino acid transporter
LARVHPRTRTPIRATALGGGIVLVMALAVPFEHLLVVANMITLAIFTLVALALWRVKRRPGSELGEAFRIPAWVPPLAAILCLGLIGAELVGFIP